MRRLTCPCLLILLLLTCGLKCNTNVARVMLPELTETDAPAESTAPQFEMEAILATRGEVHSPIPDDIYEWLWGHWTAAGLSAPRDYYTKYIDAGGIAIVVGDLVDDGLFQAARHVVLVMTAKVPGIREALSINAPDVDNSGRRFQLAILPGYEETASDLPDVEETFHGSIFAYPLAAAQIVRIEQKTVGGTTSHPIVRLIIHEMAHAIHHTLIARPYLLPDFGENLEEAWLHEREQLGDRDVWEFWAEFIENHWLDEWNTPRYLAEEPNHEFRRKRHPRIVALAEEVFPAFPLAVAIYNKDYTQ